jgi:hypothetical protein
VSWNDLAWLGLTVRPFDGRPPPRGYQHSRFDTTFRRTLKTLAKEMEHLDASNIVVELDVSERDIRLDGFPRANARIGNPCVAISFDSKHGPLRYATGEYDSWQDNIRAIAVSLEALRAVDRHAVSKRGEQYRGWRAIPMSTDPADAIQTPEQAHAVLEPFAGDWKRAAAATHPDKPDGNAIEFRKVMRAKEVLEDA